MGDMLEPLARKFTWVFRWVVLSLLLQAAPAAAAATYYVRTDGGSATECTGLVDAPYPGTGLAQPCAWDHPFQALPPDGVARMAGGDTLTIGSGSYRMGYGASGDDACDSSFPWACHMLPVPSGPSVGSPTRILGAGWNSGCAAPPELWGAERANVILDLTGASNVEIACLEITDREGCVEFHTGSLTCDRNSYPYGDWASVGLYAEDSANVGLTDLDIHGLAHTGIHAGRLTDWTLTDVRLGANGWVGWDGDIDGGDSNSGTMQFTGWTVEWNGCGETWPGEVPSGCWAQSAGGYGDGVGTGATAGDWMIEDSVFRYNTSDGLDLLYASLGSSITIRRTLAEGNAGNQIKTSGPALIENTVAVGNCGFFDGKAFTYNVDNCRALGNAVSIHLRQSDAVTLVNSTVAGEGDCLVLAGCDGGADGSESLVLRNNVFRGHTDFLQPFENSCLTYADVCPSDPFDTDYSVILDVKNAACPGANDVCGSPLGLVNDAIDNFDARLQPTSPAVDSGTGSGATWSTPSNDITGFARPFGAAVDRGAYESDGAVITTTTSTTTTTTTTTTTSTTTTLAALCPPTPGAGCRAAATGGTSLGIRNSADNNRDRFDWKWRKGAATTASELCDGTDGSAEYRVCVYDSSADPQPLAEMALRSGATCGSRPCWKTTGTKGCRYKDKSRTPDGIIQAKLRGGVAGKAALGIKGSGTALAPPTLSPSGLTLPITVELWIDDGVATECWTATYATASRNGPEKLKAKGP